MTVKEVLVDVLDRLSKKDLKTKLLTLDAELTDDENAFCSLLLSLFDLVQDEVATEYVPLICKESVQSEYGKFNLNSLQNTPAYILSLKDLEGQNIKYKMYGHEIFFLGKAEIEYCYVPQKATLTGNVEIVLPKRCIVYGVLREYYLSQELLQEASFYEEKFKNSLLIFSRKHGEIKMPVKNWE